MNRRSLLKTLLGVVAVEPLPACKTGTNFEASVTDANGQTVAQWTGKVSFEEYKKELHKLIMCDGLPSGEYTIDAGEVTE